MKQYKAPYVFILTEPAWAFYAVWSQTYFSLYMIGLGIPKAEIGILFALFGIIQAISALFGGYSADRFGRKRTLMTGDFFSWVFTIGLWAFSHNLSLFLLGALINNATWIVQPSWNALFIEETPPHDRKRLYSLIQLVIVGCGMAAPLLGFMVASLGLMPASSLFLKFSFFTIAISWTLRLLFARDSSPRPGDRGYVPHLGFKLEGFRQAGRELLKPQILGIYLLGFLMLWRQALQNAYFPLYVLSSRGLGLPASTLSISPFLMTLANLLVIFFFLPRIGNNERLGLKIALVLVFTAQLGYLFVPAHAIYLLYLFWFVGNMGQTLFMPLQAALWMNGLPDRMRANILAIGSSFSLVLTTPVLYLASFVYPYSPHLFLIYYLLPSLVSLLFLLPRKKGIDHSIDPPLG